MQGESLTRSLISLNMVFDAISENDMTLMDDQLRSRGLKYSSDLLHLGYAPLQML
ncbi:hypothetical protein ASPWEDRAFT_44490 [Aspergillus wentii DTO 134E9]|uniref:Uncharacterized protein n=1 Tax=Aspergillus wentii DTO 134E9 TaxID=1073089 RepID=A0A1L9RBU5_ASPWE|nr:uncharacterized protein ASPWEDRAFT_44490 [Aspergillus wentii DTO 134E9]OJJ32386.1 hypothetical protein ASPWEDRAFT_44490 [Aspergillus wentii DTO 134E9]